MVRIVSSFLLSSPTVSLPEVLTILCLFFVIVICCFPLIVILGRLTAFMDSHLTSQSSTIFRSVHSLIYIFDAESSDLLGSDTHYFLKCLGQLKDQTISSSSLSPDLSSSVATLSSSQHTTSSVVGEGKGEGPTVFVLLHKMDLVPTNQQITKLKEFELEVNKRVNDSTGCKGISLKFYGTSIWNETLYKVCFLLLSLLPFFFDVGC